MTCKTSSLVALAALSLAAAGAAVAASAPTAPYSAARTSACLSAHNSLASAADSRRFLSRTAKPQPVAVISVGFPFSNGQAALDSALVAFMKSPADGTRGRAAFVAAAYATAARHGMSQAAMEPIIRRNVVLRGNAVVVWTTGPHAPSRATLLACFR